MGREDAIGASARSDTQALPTCPSWLSAPSTGQPDPSTCSTVNTPGSGALRLPLPRCPPSLLVPLPAPTHPQVSAEKTFFEVGSFPRPSSPPAGAAAPPVFPGLLTSPAPVQPRVVIACVPVGSLRKGTISCLLLYLRCLAECPEHEGLNKCWLSEWFGFWVDGRTGGWVGGKPLNICNMESTLSVYADGIYS